MFKKIKRFLDFNLRYLGDPPWDTGVSPPELINFLQTAEPGRALDLGCGSGTNLLTLAKKSGNKPLVKYLKEKGASRNFRPYINSLGLGMDVIANGNNTFFTGILSIHEDKYNLNLDLFAGSRTKAILVPLEISDYSTYLLYEDRHVAGIGLNKDFDIFKPISGWRYGINTGVLHTYSWATYKGYRPHPTPEFTTGGSVSAFAKYDFFRIATGYQYMKFPSLNYRPHHFFLRIQVFLRFNDDIYYNILI